MLPSSTLLSSAAPLPALALGKPAVKYGQSFGPASGSTLLIPADQFDNDSNKKGCALGLGLLGGLVALMAAVTLPLYYHSRVNRAGTQLYKEMRHILKTTSTGHTPQATNRLKNSWANLSRMLENNDVKGLMRKKRIAKFSDSKLSEYATALKHAETKLGRIRSDLLSTRTI